ncbi:hypothetical protein D1007_14358 [Hordeum vulgare]|nr:hypothetical protein D1007_14358 [Hordeum vulgare]
MPRGWPQKILERDARAGTVQRLGAYNPQPRQHRRRDAGSIGDHMENQQPTTTGEGPGAGARSEHAWSEHDRDRMLMTPTLEVLSVQSSQVAEEIAAQPADDDARSDAHSIGDAPTMWRCADREPVGPVLPPSDLVARALMSTLY